MTYKELYKKASLYMMKKADDRSNYIIGPDGATPKDLFFRKSSKPEVDAKIGTIAQNAPQGHSNAYYNQIRRHLAGTGIQLNSPKTKHLFDRRSRNITTRQLLEARKANARAAARQIHPAGTSAYELIYDKLFNLGAQKEDLYRKTGIVPKNFKVEQIKKRLEGLQAPAKYKDSNGNIDYDKWAIDTSNRVSSVEPKRDSNIAYG